MMKIVESLPPLSRKDYVRQRFNGHQLKVAGRVRSVTDFDHVGLVELQADDFEGEIIANFAPPFSPEVSLLAEGDDVEVSGVIFDVTGTSISIASCELIRPASPNELSPSSLTVPVVSDRKHWWEIWWGQILVGVAIALIAALIISLVTMLKK